MLRLSRLRQDCTSVLWPWAVSKARLDCLLLVFVVVVVVAFVLRGCVGFFVVVFVCLFGGSFSCLFVCFVLLLLCNYHSLSIS